MSGDAAILSGGPRGTSLRGGRPALGQDQRDVVMLIDWVEAANFFCDPLNGLLAGLIPVLPQAGHQPLLPEFSAVAIVSLGNSIRVEREDISWFQLVFRDGAFPFPEQAEQCASGIEPVKGVVGAQYQPGEVPAVGITQPTRGIVILGEE